MSVWVRREALSSDMTACKQVKGKPRTPENNIDQSIVIPFVALSAITLMK